LRVHVYNDSAKDVHIERAGTVHKGGHNLIAVQTRGLPLRLQDGQPGDAFIVPIPASLHKYGRAVAVWVVDAGDNTYRGRYPESDPSSPGGSASDEV